MNYSKVMKVAKQKLKEGIRIFDNGGVTWDRYTVIIPDGGTYAVFTMSENALSPDGINQYSHSVNSPEEAVLTTDMEIKQIPFNVYQATLERCKKL